MQTATGKFESGRGSTHQDYLAFWFDGERKQATTHRIVYPPHEEPVGSILDDLIVSAIKEAHPFAREVTLNGATSLYGADRAVSLGDGRVGFASLEHNGWRVVL